MDKILKEHFDAFRALGKLPPELSSLDDVTLFDEPVLSTWRNNRKGIQWVDAAGNTFMGAVDNILVRHGKLIVLDYKTRGYALKEDTAAHYQDQLDIYNLLLQKNGYKTEDYAYLLFYHPKEVRKNGDVVFNTDLVKMKVEVSNAEKIFKKALKVLEGPKPKAGKECGYCKYVGERRE
jgi:CRISPR/Cas system-associated exonuclease Cas4 (RecB family)